MNCLGLAKAAPNLRSIKFDDYIPPVGIPSLKPKIPRMPDRFSLVSSSIFFLAQETRPYNIIQQPSSRRTSHGER